MGGAMFPPCFLTWGQTMVEVMKIMATSFQRSRASHSVPPTLQQATADPHLHRRLLDTHRQVWVSLLWGHCYFLLGSGVHKVLFVPSKGLFPQSCVSSGGSMVGLMVTPSKRAYAIPRSAAPTAPTPVTGHCWPVSPQETLKHSKAGLTQSLWGLLVCTKVLFGPSEHLWWVWGLILHGISPLLPSFWGFSFALGHGVSFFGGIQHPPVNGCSAVSCNFGVLTGEDECTSFYYTRKICRVHHAKCWAGWNTSWNQDCREKYQ